METEFKQTFKFKSATLPFAKIETNEDGSVIRIFTDEFRIVINKNLVNLGWIIHRPRHDHNDLPYIVLRLPEEGKIVEGGPKPTLNLHFKGDYPNLLLHGVDVVAVNILTGEQRKCVWQDNGWKILVEEKAPK